MVPSRSLLSPLPCRPRPRLLPDHHSRTDLRSWWTGRPDHTISTPFHLHPVAWGSRWPADQWQPPGKLRSHAGAGQPTHPWMDAWSLSPGNPWLTLSHIPSLYRARGPPSPSPLAGGRQRREGQQPASNLAWPGVPGVPGPLHSSPAVHAMHD